MNIKSIERGCMKKFKELKTYCVCVAILGVVMSMLTGCGGGGGGVWNDSGSGAAGVAGAGLEATPVITAYSLSGVAGTINEPAKTIAITMPFGTNVTSQIATYTTTGTIVKIGAATQKSGVTANNFTSSLIYTVTSASGKEATYTITVVVASISDKAITAYSFVGYPASPGTINELAKTIAVTLPFGADVTALTAKFTTSGTGVKIGVVVQTSEAPPTNNFTTSKAYTVTAGDLSTATYTVTVTVGSASLKTITAYSFVGFTAFPGTVDEAAKTIAVTLPFGTDVTAMTAKFTTTGTIVKIGAVVQTSEALPTNDFTTSKAYTVTAADLSTATYTVTVTLAPNNLKTITAYSFVGFTGFPGTVDEAAKTITVKLPLGTPVTALSAKFTTTGTVVKIGTVVQTSEAPPTNNFTTSKAYTVTAADLSTATYTVTVIVTNAPDLGAAAPFGGFGGSATLTNDGLNTIINGDIGVNAASSKITGLHDSGANVYTITGSNDGTVTGLIYTLTAPPGSVAAEAVTRAGADALVAFNAISPANLTGGIDVSNLAQCPSCGGGGADDLGGRTLPPGIYKSATGTYFLGAPTYTQASLTLDAGGDADAVWVFQTAAGTGTLTVGLTGPATPAVPIRVLFKNGVGKPKNVFWYVPAGATIGTGSTMVGTMLANASITFSTTGGGPPPNAVITTLNGRAICLTAGVTMTNTVINVPAP
jgi:hypothetical protein